MAKAFPEESRGVPGSGEGGGRRAAPVLQRLWARLSLAARVMLSASLALVVAGALLLSVSTGKDADFSRAQIEERLADDMESLLPAISEWAVIGDYANIEQIIQLRVKRTDAHRIVWTNARGKTLEAIDKLIAPHAPEWFIRWVNVPAPQASRKLLIGGRDYGSVTVEMTATPIHNRLWDAFLGHLAILTLALGLAFAGILLILRSGLRPLAALDQGARALENGEMSARIPLQGSPELAHTIAAFNRMAESVEAAQNELRQTLDRIAMAAGVFEHAAEGIIITDAGQHIIEVNPAFSQITGYSRAEVLGKTPRLLSSGRHDAAFFTAMWEGIKVAGKWRGEILNRHKNGELYPEQLSIVAVCDAEGKGTRYIGIFSDISELKAHEARLQHLAHYDSLTGLPNRVLLTDRMKVALAQVERTQEKLAVCYLDLDGFKAINDTHGHAVGDHLLAEVSERLREAVRGGDTLARLGGDEFVILLVALADIDECESALLRVLEAVARPVVVDGIALAVSASIGATICPDDGADPDTLLRHADQAMYAAKEAGRNRFHLFDPRHDHTVRKRRELLERLETALINGEFCLHYQPKVDMRAGTVIGAEALIRWRHPERGIIQPAEFLPTMENTELEIRVGEWVIETGLSQMDAWRAVGLDLPVSVNITPNHLARIDFAERLKGSLGRHPGTPDNRLELEVLESAALDDIVHVSSTIEACRRIGVPFSLDDFGTGYSSLTYLKRLPADTLKIDQSFVRDMLTDSDDMAIVEGIIGLSEAFHLSVIAEGVETVEHGLMLLNLGCSFAQGYGIARPMPAEDMPGWVATWQSDRSWRTAPATWSRDDAILLGAEMDHRYWVEQLQSYLASEPPGGISPPPPDSHLCRFGRWYHGPGRLRYGAIPEFHPIAYLHQQVHALGGEIVMLCKAGRKEEAHELMAEVAALRDHLVAHLQALMAAIHRQALAMQG